MKPIVRSQIIINITMTFLAMIFGLYVIHAIQHGNFNAIACSFYNWNALFLVGFTVFVISNISVCRRFGNRLSGIILACCAFILLVIILVLQNQFVHHACSVF